MGGGPNGFALHSAQISSLTLWASMRLVMRLRPPCTGLFSASFGFILYYQRNKACRASMNWPEISRASSNLCCLRRAHKPHHWHGDVSLTGRPRRHNGSVHLSMQDTGVQSAGREDPLEQEMPTCSSIHAGKIPWTEEPGGLQSHRVMKSWTRLSI